MGKEQEHEKREAPCQSKLSVGLAIFERQIKEKMTLPKHLMGGNEGTTACAIIRAIKDNNNKIISSLTAEHGGITIES